MIEEHNLSYTQHAEEIACFEFGCFLEWLQLWSTVKHNKQNAQNWTPNTNWQDFNANDNAPISGTDSAMGLNSKYVM